MGWTGGLGAVFGLLLLFSGGMYVDDFMFILLVIVGSCGWVSAGTFLRKYSGFLSFYARRCSPQQSRCALRTDPGHGWYHLKL